MANGQEKFTRLAVTFPTRRKTAVLAKALDIDIYKLVEEWAEREWVEQKHEGLVTDAMLGDFHRKESA